MEHPFEQKLAVRWPAPDWADLTVLVAVSGGADSMALLRGMVALRSGGKGRLVVAHFNHHLRGAESDADQSFVRAQSQHWNLPCEVGSAEPNSPSPSEAAARQARYVFLSHAAGHWGARFVATAHTADDQAETILQRILRGTGLDGLTGIPPSRQLLPGVSIIRPLLDISRTEILDYLHGTQQPFREDSSNAELRFTRNKLRLELIPLLENEYNPRVTEALLRLGQLSAEAQEVIGQAARTLRQRVVESADERSVQIRCSELSSADGYLVRQMLLDVWRERGWGLRDMSHEHWRQLADLAVTKSDCTRTMTFPGAVRGTNRHDATAGGRLGGSIGVTPRHNVKPFPTVRIGKSLQPGALWFDPRLAF